MNNQLNGKQSRFFKQHADDQNKWTEWHPGSEGGGGRRYVSISLSRFWLGLPRQTIILIDVIITKNKIITVRIKIRHLRSIISIKLSLRTTNTKNDNKKTKATIILNECEVISMNTNDSDLKFPVRPSLIRLITCEKVQDTFAPTQHTYTYAHEHAHDR